MEKKDLFYSHKFRQMETKNLQSVALWAIVFGCRQPNIKCISQVQNAIVCVCMSLCACKTYTTHVCMAHMLMYIIYKYTHTGCHHYHSHAHVTKALCVVGQELCRHLNGVDETAPWARRSQVLDWLTPFAHLPPELISPQWSHTHTHTHTQGLKARDWPDTHQDSGGLWLHCDPA